MELIGFNFQTNVSEKAAFDRLHYTTRPSKQTDIKFSSMKPCGNYLSQFDFFEQIFDGWCSISKCVSHIFDQNFLSCSDLHTLSHFAAQYLRTFHCIQRENE